MTPPKKELTESEKISSAVVPSLLQATLHHSAEPPPAPETFSGAYGKKGEDSNSVIAMINLLIRDLDKEMTEAETEEKDAQKDYETMLADAKAKRATDSKAVQDKNAAKAS